MDRSRISFPEKEKQKKSKRKFSPRRKGPKRQHSPIRNRRLPKREVNRWKANGKKKDRRQWKRNSNNNGQRQGGGRGMQQESGSWRAESQRAGTPQPGYAPIMVISPIPYPSLNPSFISPPHPMQYIPHPTMPQYFPHPTPPMQQYRY